MRLLVTATVRVYTVELLVALAVIVNLPCPVCVTVATAPDQPDCALTAATMAAAMSVAPASFVSEAVVAVSEGEALVSVSV